jgi:hypothetical protein
MRLLGTLLVLALMVGGCATAAQETWSRPSATRQALSRDLHECERAATFDSTHGQEMGAYGFSPVMNQPVLASCMRARGYELVTDRR